MFLREWSTLLRGLVLSGLLVLASLAIAQPELPTPAPPPTAPPLDRPVFEPPAPRAPADAQPVIGPDGKRIAPTYEESRARTRPDTPDSNAPAEGFTHGGDGETVGKIGDPLVMPFGSKGERVAIAFRSGDFVPPVGEKIQPALRLLAQQRAQSFNPASGTTRPSVYAMILFNERLTPGMREQMEAAGIQFYSFYPYAAYQARIPVDVLARLEATDAVRWVGMPEPIQKLDPELIPLMQKGGRERVLLYINLFGPDADGSIAATLRAAGISVYQYHPDLHFYYAEGDAQAIWNALSMDSVLFIEPVPLSTPAHTESQTSINADRLWGTQYDGRPRDGRQIKIGVMDSGMNTAHQDFANLSGGMFGYNRTTEQNWWNDLNGHGTHVSGTLFGQGNAQFRYRGFASGFRESSLEPYDLLHSKVFRSDNFSEGNSVGEGLEDMRGRGNADIKRHLFNYSGGFAGTNLPGTDAQSRTVDLAFGEDILPVIAAGNEGPNAGTVRGPGVAKGALTVGNISDDGETTVDNMESDSSRGPTGDGRFKPDVVAPGRPIDSTSHTDNSGYRTLGGTSMAAPHVAGLAATLKLHYNWPAWAIRAIIMGTAIDLGHGRNNQGLGKVDALLSHFAWNGGWETWFWQNGGTGDLRYIDVNVPAGCTKLRVTLVYPDPPAASGASVALVNDLDLYVQTGTLTTDRSGNWSSFSSRNTVEVVEVTNPPAGTYRVKVYTYAQNSGSSQAWAFNLHYTFGSQAPNINLSLSAPAAVKPSTNFTVTGTATAGSYVASGVFAKLTVPTGGLTRNGLTFYRRAPSGGEESVYFNGVFGKNMGNIGHTLSRKFDWSMTSGATEGVRTVRMSVVSNNGNNATLDRNVIVDGTPPTNWGGFSPQAGSTPRRPPARFKCRMCWRAWTQARSTTGTTHQAQGFRVRSQRPHPPPTAQPRWRLSTRPMCPSTETALEQRRRSTSAPMTVRATTATAGGNWCASIPSPQASGATSRPAASCLARASPVPCKYGMSLQDSIRDSATTATRRTAARLGRAGCSPALQAPTARPRSRPSLQWMCPSRTPARPRTKFSSPYAIWRATGGIAHRTPSTRPTSSRSPMAGQPTRCATPSEARSDWRTTRVPPTSTPGQATACSSSGGGIARKAPTANSPSRT
jgi:serine protease AprX